MSFPGCNLCVCDFRPTEDELAKNYCFLKKECYRSELRTLKARRCTNEDIGKEMNVISDWLLQYVRRKKRVFSLCNPAVCIPWKGRIG